MATASLFQNVPSVDPLGFGTGAGFMPTRVRDFLRFSKVDVAQLAGVAVSSVRYDAAMPAAVEQALRQVGATCNLVAELLDDDVAKAELWFMTENPMLGNVAPREMIQRGRFSRLHRFVAQAAQDRVLAAQANGRILDLAVG